MNIQELKITSESDWSTIAMDLVDSTKNIVATLIADRWEIGNIYSLNINIRNNEWNNIEILVKFIQDFILKIQETEENFVLSIKLPNPKIDQQYSEVAKKLQESNYIDSLRFRVTKGTSDKYLQLSCS